MLKVERRNMVLIRVGPQVIGSIVGYQLLLSTHPLASGGGESDLSTSSFLRPSGKQCSPSGGV